MEQLDPLLEIRQQVFPAFVGMICPGFRGVPCDPVAIRVPFQPSASASMRGSNAMTLRGIAVAGHRFRGFGRAGLAIAMATKRNVVRTQC